MPTAPDLVPTQPASGSGISNVNIGVPVDAFGGAVGHAVEGLGTAIEQAGDKVWNRAIAFQTLQNQTEANKADAAYMETAGKLHADFSSLQGENATAAFPKYIQDLKDAREAVRQNLSNGMVQKMYDSTSLGVLGRTIFNGAGHAGEQAKVAQLDALTQRQTTIIATAATSNDPGQVEQARRDLAKIIQQKHALKGTSESVSDEELVVNSSLTANTLSHKAFTDPVGALDELEQAKDKGQLTDDDYDKAYAKILPRRNSMLAANIADKIYAEAVDKDGNAKIPFADAAKKVEAEASRAVPDDSLFAKQARAAFEARYNQNNYAKRQENLQNTQTIDEAIVGGAQTLRDIQNNPATARAYDDLPSPAKLAVGAKLQAAQRRADAATSQDELTRLYGMAKSGDPDATAQFMDTDILSNEKLNPAAKRQLIGLRAQILKSDTDDTRVTRAMQWLKAAQGPALTAAGLYRRNINDPDDYDKFQGALHFALEDWHETHGKPASQQDVVERIAPLLMKQHVEKGWLHGTNKVPDFKGPPPEVAEKLKADARNSGKDEPTDRHIQREYVKFLLRENYPTARKAQPVGGNPPAGATPNE